MKLLFCTDGSQISMHTLKDAMKWFQKCEIDIICVIDWSFLPDSMRIDECGYEKTYSGVAETILEHAAEVIEKNEFIVGKKLRPCGSPVESILEALGEEDYEAVLLGSYGKKGIEKWLGSVSTQILEGAEIPIYISKRKTVDKRILFTSDGSETAYNAIRRAVALLDLSDSQIHICTVQSEADLLFAEGNMDANWILNIERQQKIYSLKVLNRVKNYLQERNHKVVAETILVGNTARKIIDYSISAEIDLIVLGTRTKSPLTGFFSNSVTKRVLEGTTSDVFAVKNYQE